MFDISYDKFIRTTDPDHVVQIQKMFRRFYEQGDIYLGKYSGLYCTPCESFWTESQLMDGKCPDCGRAVTESEEDAYFFRMGKYADCLITHIRANPGFISPVSRENEMINNFLLPGLQDLCVSRTSFKWGIPVDFDDKHVVYVWMDALSNYITGLGYDVDGDHGERYHRYWPAELHLIGKDIVRFHTIYWPIFLMALGEPLPAQVFGHPWLLTGNAKMSKTTGNILYADDLAAVYGVDGVRYYCLAEMPYDHDGTITEELLTERYNSDLANVLGNLVKRTAAMSNKYFDGVVSDAGVHEPVDDDLKAMAAALAGRVGQHMDNMRIADALGAVMDFFRRCNKYIDETEPWVLAKDADKADRLRTVMYNLVEAIEIGATLLAPFMPATAGRIAEQLGATPRDYADLGRFGLRPTGLSVTPEPETLFERKSD